MQLDYNLLQPHTIALYDLRNRQAQVCKVAAQSLLCPTRFDLWAKLFYARNRKSNPGLARDVYSAHILAFNPDQREPGRDDKSSVDDFIAVFDALIDEFERNEFDADRSVIPVDENGVILDGAHRVAALAHSGKQVTIARFSGVRAVCDFDEAYFRNRGLAQRYCDIIALEMLQSMPNAFVACLWPRLSESEKLQVENKIVSFSTPCFRRKFRVNLDSFTRLIAKVYERQPWVGNPQNGFAGARDKATNCYGKSCLVECLFFQHDNLSEVVALKEEIRDMFAYSKHALHITDNAAETQDVAWFVLDGATRDGWLYASRGGWWQKCKEHCRERWHIFRNVTLIRLKERLWRMMHPGA